MSIISLNCFLARVFASSAVAEQKSTFRSWGLLADWDNECYYTYDKKYVQNQLKQFYKLYEKVSNYFSPLEEKENLYSDVMISILFFSYRDISIGT